MPERSAGGLGTPDRGHSAWRLPVSICPPETTADRTARQSAMRSPFAGAVPVLRLAQGSRRREEVEERPPGLAAWLAASRSPRSHLRHRSAPARECGRPSAGLVHGGRRSRPASGWPCCAASPHTDSSASVELYDDLEPVGVRAIAGHRDHRQVRGEGGEHHRVADDRGLRHRSGWEREMKISVGVVRMRYLI